MSSLRRQPRTTRKKAPYIPQWTKGPGKLASLATGYAAQATGYGKYYRAAKVGYGAVKGVYNYATRKKPFKGHNTSTRGSYGLNQEVVKLNFGMKTKPNKYWLDSDKLQKITFNYTNAIELQVISQQQQYAQGEMIWNPLVFIDANQQLNTNTGTTANLNNVLNNEMRIGEYNGIATILNQTNTPVTVTVYTCMYRQDTNTAIVRYNSAAPTTYTNQTAWIDIQNGLNTGQPFKTGTYSAEAVTNPGITPYQSPNFCGKYKIISTRKIDLNAGATVKHEISDCRKQTINFGRVATTATAAQGKLTYFRLYRLQGTAANAGAGTIPGIAKAEISILEEHRYRMALCPLNQTFSMQNFNVFPATPGQLTDLGTATTDINEMTNVSTTVINA